MRQWKICAAPDCRHQFLGQGKYCSKKCYARHWYRKNYARIAAKERVRKEEYRKRRLAQRRHDLVLELYVRGVSAEALAKRYHVTIERIYEWLQP